MMERSLQTNATHLAAIPAPSSGRMNVLAKTGSVRHVDDMVTVARCLNIDQALFMRSLLVGCGIEAFVPDEFAAQTDPVIFLGSMNSIRVQVNDEDGASARTILAQNGIEAETQP